MKSFFISFSIGILFGAGLALSGMTDPNKVISFLDIFGDWDITLMVVMIGGLLITLPTFQWLSRRFSKPLFANAFNLPTKTTLDNKLILGAVIFGCGWGISGICPGPAIASLAYLNIQVPVFVFFIIVGMLTVDKFQQLNSKSKT